MERVAYAILIGLLFISMAGMVNASTISTSRSALITANDPIFRTNNNTLYSVLRTATNNISIFRSDNNGTTWAEKFNTVQSNLFDMKAYIDDQSNQMTIVFITPDCGGGTYSVCFFQWGIANETATTPTLILNADDGASEQITLSHIVKKANGNLSFVAKVYQSDIQTRAQLYDLRGMSFSLLNTLVDPEDQNGYQDIEVRGNTIFEFHITHAGLNITNITDTGIASADVQLINTPVTFTTLSKDSQGDIFSISQDGSNNKFILGKAIINNQYSSSTILDYSASGTGIFFPYININPLNNYIYLTFGSSDGYCYLIESTDGGLTFPNRVAFDTTPCTAINPVRPINTTLYPQVEVQTYNQSTASKLNTFYSNYTIPLPVTIPETPNVQLGAQEENSTADTLVYVGTPTIHGAETGIYIYNRSNGVGSNTYVLEKFNTTKINGHLIDQAYLNYYINTYGCSVTGPANSRGGYYYNYSSWLESTFAGTTFNTVGGTNNIIGSTLWGGSTTGLNYKTLNEPISVNANYLQNSSLLTSSVTIGPVAVEWWNAIYNNKNVSMIFTNSVNVQASQCPNPTSLVIINSREGGYAMRLKINVLDYYTGLIQGSDISTTAFDFQSTNAQSSNYTLADFFYDVSNNKMYPAVPMAPYNTEFNNSNDLSDVDCSQGSYIYGPSNPATYGINVPAGTYDILCFNLSTKFNGQQGYYGAIKVIANTNIRGGLLSAPDFDFYYAVYSPNLTSFVNIVKNPDPPLPGIPLTISWLTNHPLTTGLQFRITQNNITGGWTYFNDSALSQYHNITINASSMVNGNYEFILTGFNAQGTLYNSSSQFFNVGTSSVFTNANENSTLPQGVQNLVNSGFFDQSTAIYFFGMLLLFIITGMSFILGGFRMGITGFVSMLVAETIIGLLPIFLLIPIIVIVALIVTILFRRIFFGEGAK